MTHSLNSRDFSSHSLRIKFWVRRPHDIGIIRTEIWWRFQKCIVWVITTCESWDMTQSLNSRDYLVPEAFIIRNWPNIGKLPIKRFQIFWRFIICEYHDHLGSKIDPKKVEKAKISYLIWVITDWSWHAYLSFPNF